MAATQRKPSRHGVPARGLVILIALSLAACGDGPGEAPLNETEPAVRALTEADSNRPVTLRVHELFGIALTDNASIGHVWRAAEVPPVLRSEGFMYTGDTAERSGAGTAKTFRFAGLQPGRGRLRMELSYRGAPERIVDFDVVVTD